MARPETPGIRYIDQLKLGIDELGRLQDEYSRLRGKMAHMMHTGRRGLLIPRASSGQLRRNWQVLKSTGGKIVINTGFDLPPYDEDQHPPIDVGVSLGAIDDDGFYFEYEDDHSGLATSELLQVPDDNTWYTLVVRRVRTSREKGYLNVTTGSATVTGVGTEFTRLLEYTGDAFDAPRGALIRIPDDTEYPAGVAPLPLGATGSANGNEGVIEVDSVTNDTQLTLRSPVPGTTENGLAWMIEGDFQGTSPTAPGADVFRYDRAEFELVARTVTPAAGDLILADVKYDTGGSDPDLQIVDRRMADVYRPWRDRPLGSPRLAPVVRAPSGYLAVTEAPTEPNTGMTDFDHQIRRLAATSGNVLHAAHVAPKSGRVTGTGPGWLAALQYTNQITMRAFGFYDATNQHHRVWGSGGLTSPDATGTATEAFLLQIPQPDEQAAGTPVDATHLIFYIKSGVLYYKPTPDEAQTWGSQTLVWDPTTIDVNDLVKDVFAWLLQCGRIIVMASYWDDSAGIWSVRWVFSDDLGATWDTDTNAGYIWALDPGVTLSYLKPKMFQDDFGRIHTCFYGEQHPDISADVGVYYEKSISETTIARVGGTSNPDLYSAVAAEGLGGSNPLSPCLEDWADLAIWADPDGNAIVLASCAQLWTPGTPQLFVMTHHVFGEHVNILGSVTSRLLESPDYVGFTFYTTQATVAVANKREMSTHLIQGAAGVHLCYLEPEEDTGNGFAYFIPVGIDYTPVHLKSCYV